MLLMGKSTISMASFNSLGHPPLQTDPHKSTGVLAQGLGEAEVLRFHIPVQRPGHAV